MTRRPDGALERVTTFAPIVAQDEWTVLSSGTVAIVRGHDYHVDWIYADGAGRGGQAATVVTARSDLVPVGELPDYLPAIRAGAVRGDRDGNLWILPTTSAASISGELVYDVVNSAGDLFERVRLPRGRSIVGFGRGGVVYMLARDAQETFRLERARLQ